MSDMEKMNALSEKIEKMQKQAMKSTKVYAIIYLVVVLFVFIYTNVIMEMIKVQVTPDNLSAQLRVTIEEQLLSDENCEKVISYCKEQGPIWAEDLVGMTHKQIIPMVKLQVKDAVDKTADEGIVAMQKELFPKIKKLINANAHELSKHKDITDQNIANEMAKILVDECEKQIDGFINDNVKYRIGVLRDQLENMSSSPLDKLSKKQAAERKVIVSWVYLLEHGESPADSFGELLKSINGTYEDFMQDLAIPDK